MLSIIQAAGWPVWPLIACSVLAFALILERLIALRRPLVTPTGLVDEVLQVSAKDVPSPEIIDKLAAGSLQGQVIAEGLRQVRSQPDWQPEELRRTFELAGREAAFRLERRLPALGTLATAAPLLGLLGTVVGMIELFGAQQSAGAGNPVELAHGISVALYNTALGLLVAIPSLMVHRHLRARINDYLHVMELGCERLHAHLVRTHLPRGGRR